MYSKIVLLLFFLIIVVLGVFLNKCPTVPDGFLDSGFCARNIPGDYGNCQRFYTALGYSGMLKNMTEPSQKEQVVRYINAHKELLKLEPNIYPSLSPEQQFRDIIKHLNGDTTVTATESSRQSVRLSSVCPSGAHYDANGKIHVEPSGQTFDSMIEYTNYLAAFFARNTGCSPIGPVRPYTGPQLGVLGGGGTGTASASQIDSQQALSDLYDKWDSQVSPRKPGEIPVRTFQIPAPGEQTYAKTPINSLDDYEFNRVF
jgi:hypothetical protein